MRLFKLLIIFCLFESQGNLAATSPFSPHTVTCLKCDRWVPCCANQKHQGHPLHPTPQSVHVVEILSKNSVLQYSSEFFQHHEVECFSIFFFSSAFVTGVTHTALQWTSPVKQRWKIHTKRMLQWLQNGPGTEQINLVKKTHEVVGMRGGVMNSKSLHLH